MSSLLKVFGNKRIAVTLLLAFSSGLPLPLVMGTLVAWLADKKVSLASIGIFTLVTQPYNWKFLWAPIMDRYSLPFLNRRTSWIALFQVLLILMIAVMGSFDPLLNPFMLALSAFVVAFLSASQDIAIDAYRVDLLHEDERGAGAGVTVMGARIALITSGAIALMLSDWIPWSAVYYIMAGLMGVGLLTSIFGPEPEGEPAQPRKIADAVIKPWLDFLTKDKALLILLFVVVYKFGDAVVGTMTTPFMMKLEISKTEIGAINKGFGMVATILGSMVGGGFIARIGLWRGLLGFGVLQCLSNLLFAAFAVVGKNHLMMLTAIGVENICSGMGTAAFTAFLMGLCNKKFSATQYALLSSLFAQGRSLAALSSGLLANQMPWPQFFILGSSFGIPGLILLWILRDSLSSETPSGATSPSTNAVSSAK